DVPRPGTPGLGSRGAACGRAGRVGGVVASAACDASGVWSEAQRGGGRGAAGGAGLARGAVGAELARGVSAGGPGPGAGGACAQGGGGPEQRGAGAPGAAPDGEAAAHRPPAAVLGLPGGCGGGTGGGLRLPAPGAAPADVRLVGVTAHRAPDTRTESVKPARGCVRRCLGRQVDVLWSSIRVVDFHRRLVATQLIRVLFRSDLILDDDGKLRILAR